MIKITTQSKRAFIAEFKEKVLWNSIDDYLTDLILKQAAYKIKRSYPQQEIEELISTGKLKIVEEYHKFKFKNDAERKENKGSFGAFIYRVSLNVMFDFVKKQHGEGKAFKRLDLQKATEYRFSDYEIIQQGKEELDREQKTQAAVKQLSEEQQAIIILKFGLFEEPEHTIQQIVNKTELSKRRVYQLLKAGLEELEEQLREFEEEESRPVKQQRARKVKAV